ncbi:WXG100 family type VII secretion target [Nonomuraea bangladeshensis]|uniref:WXG100 family type VII secretion target n=1 Tax=Nonomuraea bangladeshensis TaxID=404385 RepID=UPI003C2C3F5E
MSIYKEMSMFAASTALASAFFIGQPWAFYVASAIGTLVSDPEGMETAAKNWRTSDHNGEVEELDKLDTELAGLKTQLQNDGTWEGEAFKSFEAVHTSYKDSLKQLKEVRNATGDGVDSTAGFYKVCTYLCNAIALSMAGLAVYKVASKASPLTAAFSEGVAAAFGKITLTAIKKVLGKQILVAGGLTYALYTAIQASEMAGKVFPSLKAIPTEMATMQNGGGPPFSQGGLEYNEDAGSLMPKMDKSMKA